MPVLVPSGITMEKKRNEDMDLDMGENDEDGEDDGITYPANRSWIVISVVFMLLCVMVSPFSLY